MSLEGIADLPLHEGHVPQWLAKLMKRLAKAILTIMVDEFGPDKVVERLSNPLWFQAFNNVIGMDWDSSGSTTVTTAILKEVTWENPDLGLLVLGGKGSRARQIPLEIPRAVKVLNLGRDHSSILERVSRLIAKIDTALLQDGYTLYHQALIVTRSGKWAIIQQGMNVEKKLARRYHWRFGTSFYRDPHEGIAGIPGDRVLNLVSRDCEGARKTIVDLARDKPESIVKDYAELYRLANKQRSIVEYVTPSETGLVKLDNVERIVYYRPLPTPEALLQKLRLLRDKYPGTMDDILLTRGIGPHVIRALALISDLIYNEPPSWNDPVTTPFDPFKYAYAVGGKDGIPYRVRRRDVEEVIVTLEDIIRRARLDPKDRYLALKKLGALASSFI